MKHWVGRPWMHRLLLLTVLVLPVVPLLAVQPATASTADGQQVLTLLEAGDFAALERRFAGLQAAFERGEIGEEAVMAGVAVFGRADPALRQPLAEWSVDYPDSPMAALANGLYFSHLAEVMVGGRFFRQTWWGGEGIVANRRVATLLLQEALAGNDRLVPAYAALAVALFQQQQANDGRALLAQAMEVLPNSPTILRAYAEAFNPTVGMPLNFLQSYLDQVRAEVGDSPGYDWTESQFDAASAEQLWEAGELESALASLDRAIAAFDDPAYRQRRGELLFALGRYAAATAAFAAVLRRDPDSAPAKAWTVAALTESGDAREALPLIDEAIEDDPYNPVYRRFRARARLAMDDFDGAWTDLEAALVYGEKLYSVQAERGRFLTLTDGDPAQAAEAWRQAVDLAPLETHFMLDYAAALHRAGDCDALHQFAQYRARCLPTGTCRDDRYDFPEHLIDMVCPVTTGDGS